MACPSSGEVGEDTAYFAEDFFPIGCQQNRQGGGDKENKRGGRIFDDNGFLIQIERVKLNCRPKKIIEIHEKACDFEGQKHVSSQHHTAKLKTQNHFNGEITLSALDSFGKWRVRKEVIVMDSL